MGNLVFQATLGGQVSLVGPNTASTFTLNVPAVSSTLATLAANTFTGTQTLSTLTSPAATALTLQSAGTAAVTIDTSQNVGIGTASPIGRLDAYNSGVSADIRSYVRNATVNLLMRVPDATQAQIGTETNHKLLFLQNNLERAQIDTSGNWLLGTTSVIGSGKTSILFNGATQNALEAQDSGTNSGAAFASFRNSGGTQIGSITRVGTTNAVAFNTTSDARLKSNIEDSSTVLDKLLTVKVRKFDWTEGDIHQEYGFIAQELEPILSGIVTKGKTEEDTWQLDYSRLTPHLVKAIQELKAINDELTARVVALEAK
jgi:hypothetical protein